MDYQTPEKMWGLSVYFHIIERKIGLKFVYFFIITVTVAKGQVKVGHITRGTLQTEFDSMP